MRKDLLIELYKYGMHLGSNHFYNTNLNYFVLGTRFNYAIINMNKSFYIIKKVLLFLKTLSLNQGSICFYHTLFNSMNIIYQTCLLNIVLKSFQSMIVHPWLYGSINNYYFSYFFFIKEIIDIWSKDSRFLLSKIENKDGFFQDDLHLLKKNISNNYRKAMNIKSNKDKESLEQIEKAENTLDWLNNQTYNFKLNYPVSFVKKICNNSLHTILKQKKIFKFKYFFLRFFFFLYEKKSSYLFLNKQSDMEDPFSKINKRVLFYWRLLLYYKYFQSFFELPDCLFSVFPDGNDTPLKEVSRSNEIVSIGLVDTDSSLQNIHYPIVVNDDSMIIIFFFFTLFSNIFLNNKLYIYNKLLFSKNRY